MKNIRVFYLKIFSVFGGEIFYIFEKACFRNGGSIKAEYSSKIDIFLSKKVLIN